MTTCPHSADRVHPAALESPPRRPTLQCSDASSNYPFLSVGSVFICLDVINYNFPGCVAGHQNFINFIMNITDFNNLPSAQYLDKWVTLLLCETLTQCSQSLFIICQHGSGFLCYYRWEVQFFKHHAFLQIYFIVTP